MVNSPAAIDVQYEARFLMATPSEPSLTRPAPIAISEGAAAYLIVAVIFLTYAPVFLSDYLAFDELWYLGKSVSPIANAIDYFWAYGRSVYGFVEALAYRWIRYDPDRVQFVRFANLALYTIYAVLLHRLLLRTTGRPTIALLTVLTLFAVPSVQALAGYSVQLSLNAHPAIFLSLASALVHFSLPENGARAWAGWILVFALCMLSFQATQSYAFISIVPVICLILSDWDRYRVKAWTYTLILIAALGFSALLLMVSVSLQERLGHAVYRLGESISQAVIAHPAEVTMRAVNPLTYWTAFKVHFFAYPLDHVPDQGPHGRAALALVMMGLWLGLMSAAAAIDFKVMASPKRFAQKWITWLVLIGMTGIWIVIDRPLASWTTEQRPHISLNLAVAAVVSGGFAAAKVASVASPVILAWSRRLIALCVIFLLLSAQASVYGRFARDKSDELTFVKTELAAKLTASTNLIYVAIPETSICLSEPCGPWFAGPAHNSPFHWQRRGLYRYALVSLGYKPGAFTIEFVEDLPRELDAESVSIDWTPFAIAKSSRR